MQNKMPNNYNNNYNKTQEPRTLSNDLICLYYVYLGFNKHVCVMTSHVGDVEKLWDQL